MNKSFIRLLLCLLISFSATAQNTQLALPKQLSIGDTLIPTSLPGMLNYPHDSASTAHFKGQWLIISFVSIACTKSISPLTTFDSVLHSYSGLVSIILATPNTAETFTSISMAMQSRRMANQPTIPVWRFPVVPQAKYLKQLFPHKRIPHLVWIDPHGVIRAFTGADHFADNLKSITGLP